MSSRPALPILLLLAGMFGCAEPPDSPGFQADVLPIFQARCLRCHGENPPAIPLADPARLFVSPFRLDRYGDELTTATQGALSMRGSVRDAIERDSDDPLRMPLAPALPLTDLQRDTISRWVASPKP